MDTTKELLEGITRLMRFLNGLEFAYITANSGKLTSSVNNERNRELSACLLIKGYGIARVDNSHIKNYRTIDATVFNQGSLFVVNIKDDPGFFQILFKLSEHYDQNTFLYKPKGLDNEAYVVGTNHNDRPSYKVKWSVGKLSVNIDDIFPSIIKKCSFLFKSRLSDMISAKSLSFAERKNLYVEKMVEMLNLDTFKQHTLYGKQAIAVIGKPVADALDTMTECSFESLIEEK